ncbi:ROK family protein [Lapidilactobacillus mulanensis]|uniref:ROK family protein n=1 Tax=Lapidilactobacillus mulanensis TaxID=2485999 RepID=A0ABW4DRS9_9LACO|nr:ROK family protein [Lapidilactobacillus mulanensis]
METSKNLVRELNRRRVLEQVFSYGPISRSQVSKNLKLNKVTVSEIVAEMIDTNLFIELGQGDSSARGGRKPTMLQLNADYGYVLSFDLGFNYIDVMMNRVDGFVLTFEHHRVGEIGIDERLAFITDKAHQFSASDHKAHKLLGVSVAIHGIVHDNKVLYTPYIDFQDKDIAQILSDELNVPVGLQNEANLSVIYQRDFESREQIDNLVCISIHKGIGAGIIINNRLFTGIHGEAGEIGHAVVYEAGAKPNHKFESIESYCSEDAILKKIKEQTDLSELTRDDIQTLYYDGNEIVGDILDEFCYYTANIVYNTIVTLDPAKVVINSNLIADIPELMDIIRGYIPYLTKDKTPVELLSNSRYATLLGGVSLIISQVIDVTPGELNFARILAESKLATS